MKPEESSPEVLQPSVPVEQAADVAAATDFESSGFKLLARIRSKQLRRMALGSLVGVLLLGSATAGVVVFTSHREEPPRFTTPPR